MAVCWMNGHVVEPTQANVSVFDHGLLYGDGVFEGLRFYYGQAFMVQEHLQRLFDSAAAIALTIPYSQEQLTAAIQQLIHQFGKPEGYIRLVVTRGVGKLGVDPGSCERANTFMIADDLTMVSQSKRAQGIRAVIVSTRRVPNSCWDARIKSLNYLNNVLAKIEARQAQADEAILLNLQGNIAEGAVNNVFVVKNQVLYTPPTHDGALAGITRDVILHLAETVDIATRQTSLTPYDLYTADEAFLTGTGVELLPVREVDGRPMQECPGKIFRQLQNEFVNFVRESSSGVHAKVSGAKR